MEIKSRVTQIIHFDWFYSFASVIKCLCNCRQNCFIHTLLQISSPNGFYSVLPYIAFVCLADVLKPYICIGLYFKGYDIFKKAICSLQKRIMQLLFSW